ncbi:type 1 fimbria pilin [Paraburkholderia rhizosphaerae]|uniref:Type 1 fimbria pilin n=2 Tax=Paraburkholderia rhizosphaerae TaxID=480658 RepID=A0A4R8LME4_9BURK|nr:type 1 fimbria pilin [Paraburkholderia rhizosphaerae]
MARLAFSVIKVRVLNKALALTTLLFLSLVATPGHAGTISCNVTSIANYSPNVPTSTFGRDAPTGTATPPYSTQLGFHCPADPCCDRDIFVTFAASPSTLASGYTDIYPTNVAGIGVRYTISNSPGTSCNGLPSTIKNASTQVTCHQMHGATSPGYDFTLSISATFIKTGPITSGPLTNIPAVSATNTINNQSGSSLWGNVFSGTASGSFSNIACSVNETAIQVTMPQANTRDLPSTGSTSGATPFNLSLNCDAGVLVAVTLTDVTTPSNRSTTLTLTPDSTAKGVGYQIAYAGTPISFGADTSAAGNPNQIFVSPSPTAGGLFPVPLKASYIRTGTINPGTANAKATFTMSYQ